MSNRSNNIDDRSRHDGKENRHLNGPVVHLDPETLQPKRTNVTEEDRAEKLKAQGRLTWSEQGEESRRLNSILLRRAAAKIDAGTETPDDIATFRQCSDTAKKWTVEERQGGSGLDPKRLTDEEIERQLKNG